MFYNINEFNSILNLHNYILFRTSRKVDTLLLYNMDGKVWFPIAASAGPKPTAYHSSVIMGDYMLSYGKLFPQLCLKSRR